MIVCLSYTSILAIYERSVGHRPYWMCGVSQNPIIYMVSRFQDPLDLSNLLLPSNSSRSDFSTAATHHHATIPGRALPLFHAPSPLGRVLHPPFPIPYAMPIEPWTQSSTCSATSGATIGDAIAGPLVSPYATIAVKSHVSLNLEL